MIYYRIYHTFNLRCNIPYHCETLGRTLKNIILRRLARKGLAGSQYSRFLAILSNMHYAFGAFVQKVIALQALIKIFDQVCGVPCE